MPTARVTTVGEQKHLILSNCPICDHAHESVLHTAESKVRIKGDLYPFWSDCPNAALDTLLIRFIETGERDENGNARLTIGMVSLHRDDPLFRLDPPK